MNDINTLMERLPSINSKDPSDLVPEDIDTLVTFYRFRRTRKSELLKKQDTSILDEILAPATPAPTKILPGIRRFTIKK